MNAETDAAAPLTALLSTTQPCGGAAMVAARTATSCQTLHRTATPFALLQDTIKARLEASTPLPPVPGTLAAPEALSRGWYPHQALFLWPAPRDPATYNTHPLKPSEYRMQELGEPFDGEAGLGAG